MESVAVVVNQNVGEYSLIARDTDDEKLVDMWVGRKSSMSTGRQYRQAWEQFRSAVDMPLQAVSLSVLQSWASALTGSDNTRKVRVACIKALFTFAHKTGYIRLNPAVMLESVKVKDELAARMLTEEEVMEMIYRTEKQRDRVLIRFLYATGARLNEVCSLTWKDIQPNGDSGQVTLFGKGGKTRVVKVSKATYQILLALRCESSSDSPVFVSQKGGHLDDTQVHRIVKQAAKRANVSDEVSAHWLRHSHASHALERGATVAVVRDTLGHSSLAITSRYTHAKPNESSALHLAV